MRRFLLIAGLLCLLTLVGTWGIHLLTGAAWLESCYLAVITLTTTGSRDLGDSPPMMAFVILFLVLGWSVFTYCAFQLGQLLFHANYRHFWERRRMLKELDRLERHYIVCGAGRMGVTIAEYLAEKGQAFVLVDRDGERLEELAHARGWRYIEGEATSDTVLQQAGIQRAQGLAATLPTDADNLYVVMSARMFSADLIIVARASDLAAEQKFKRAGATRIINPFNSGGVKMARLLVSPRVEDFLEMSDTGGEGFEVVELEVVDDAPYAEKTLAQANLTQQGVIVIGIRRATGEHVLAPGGNIALHAGDSLFIFGSAAHVAQVCGH